MRVVLPGPEVVGQATLPDFAGLDALADIYADNGLLNFMLLPDHTATTGRQREPMAYDDVIEAISWLIHPIQRELFGVGDPVEVTFERKPVANNDTQRLGDWHTDTSIGRGVGIMTSDGLPTEFAQGILKGRPGKKYVNAGPQKFREQGNGEINAVVNECLRAGSLELVPLPKLQAVKFNAHSVHRSPVNTTGSPLPRRFVRVRSLQFPY